MAILRDIAYGAAAVASSPVWGVSLLRTGKWRTDWAGRFGRAEPAGAPAGRRVLIHAVSVGEANLIRGLVDELAGAGCEVVIAATTNTGFARATALYAPRHRVVRYPLDFTGAVRRFLDAVRPDLAALVELEVWPTFIEECGRRDIPVAVVNGRLSPRSFKNYMRFRPLVRGSFERLRACGVQTEAYAQRFRALGAPDVRVLGTMKWDTAVIADHVDGADQLAEEMGIDRARPLVVAGSTAPGEEKLLIDTVPEEAQLMIVPRKPEWFDAVAAYAPGIVRRTAGRPGAGSRLFLLDTIGELRKAYALADVAVVGRSFTGKLYGSDMTEPIALGKPTLIGPHTSDFDQQMEAFTAGDGIVVTDRPGDAVRALLNDPARRQQLADNGRRVIAEQQGATTRHRETLLEMIRPFSAGPQGRDGDG